MSRLLSYLAPDDGGAAEISPGVYRIDFADGKSRIATDVEVMDARKAEKWTGIKSERAARLFDVFDWDGSTFDADAESRSLIQGAVQMALLAKSAGQPFAVEWTLADNTVRVLSADDMIAVGLALGARVNDAHIKARALRTAIADAKSHEEVQAVKWPDA
jgi:predicted mannosyl-3-phosphoglycerate phosphatase (HAD superfamily)